MMRPVPSPGRKGSAAWLTVNVPRRPPPTIEAVAYFVVSEGLANIAKHAQASQAEVFVQRSGDRLHVIVTDDGVKLHAEETGAQPSPAATKPYGCSVKY